jgi:hypothetical protein
MTDEMQLVREFRDDVPGPSDEARQRIHAYATRADGHRSVFGSMPAARARWRLGFALALVVAAAGVIAMTATRIGASPQSNTPTRQQGVDEVVSQAQSDFGDGRILSAAANGSILSVKLATNDVASSTIAAFEARVLGQGLTEWMAANGQTPITGVISQDASGTVLPGTLSYGDPVASAPNVQPLPSGSCQSAAAAASAADASLTTESVRVLPFANGVCVFDFQTTDAARFAENAPVTINKLVTAMGDPDQRPYLIQVEDGNGASQFVASWVPGDGGQTWIRPGLPTTFVHSLAPVKP